MDIFIFVSSPVLGRNLAAREALDFNELLFLPNDLLKLDRILLLLLFLFVLLIFRRFRRTGARNMIEPFKFLYKAIFQLSDVVQLQSLLAI